MCSDRPSGAHPQRLRSKHGGPVSLLLCASSLLVACGGSDVTGPDGADGGGDGGGGTPPPASPSFAQDVNPIFVARGCTSGNCHGRGAGGLTLAASVSTNFASLVNVPSTDDPAFLRVEPNDATNSYLVMKVEGRAGSRMPLGGAPLTANQIQTIRNWINSGAPDN